MFIGFNYNIVENIRFLLKPLGLDINLVQLISDLNIIAAVLKYW